MNLNQWGWKESHEKEYELKKELGLKPARVIRQYKGIYVLETGLGDESAKGSLEVQAKVSGAFTYKAVDERDFPVTGDFVLYRGDVDLPARPIEEIVKKAEKKSGPQNSVLIEEIMVRTSLLTRKASEQFQEQILATNIDYVFIIMALDGERGFLERTMERLLTQAWNSGAQPVIVLNKADLSNDPEEARSSAEFAAPGVPVVSISALENMGIESLDPFLSEGSTTAFLGQSGMGKSTLLNVLMGREIQVTAAVREQDARGRHTTSTRDLLRLPSGAMIIDTPGIRAISLSSDEMALESVFRDIADLSENCKFNDCTHSGEPNCAIQSALNEGTLDYERYQAYLEYRRELQYFERKSDRRLQQMEKEKWKAISKFARNLYKNK